MNREVIQDFLNLPGIVGVALTNRRMRPYFYGLEAILNGRQQQALAQGVVQIIETIPEGIESFEFYFIGNVAFIYKLTHGLVLLVIGNKNLDVASYELAIAQVKQLIETDVYSSVATFKLLLGNVSQPSLPDLNRTGSNTVLQSDEIITSGSESVSKVLVANRGIYPETATHKTSEPVTLPIKPETSNPKQPPEYQLSDYITALNKLSNFTTQYLGKVVVSNYWKSSRPASKWLAEFVVDRNAQISYANSTATCSPEQQQQLQEWTKAYMQRCKQVIKNFDNMVVQDCLDSQQQKLLLR
jgi:hypothetical protein